VKPEFATTNIRVLKPSQCFQTTTEDGINTILLILQEIKVLMNNLPLLVQKYIDIEHKTTRKLLLSKLIL
jgi:hypothetical protein